ncbi:MAG: Type 1 glutamine amidotransferase-like domain-containing protein [Acidobacteriota bacterium]
MPDPTPDSTPPAPDLPLAPHRQPLVLLADSQLLFWEGPDGHFLDRLGALAGDAPRAAYVGASNGDAPEYFDLFAAAFDRLDATCRAIPARPTTADRAFFDDADIVFLAGGDPIVGWRALEGNGLSDRLRPRWDEGCLLVGLSAGAMHLGLRCWSREGETAGETADSAGLAPFLIDAHDGPSWPGLHEHLPAMGSTIGGLGVPAGGGGFIHPDMTIEPIRKPLAELFVFGEEVHQSLLYPGDPGHDEPPLQVH